MTPRTKLLDVVLSRLMRRPLRYAVLSALIVAALATTPAAAQAPPTTPAEARKAHDRPPTTKRTLEDIHIEGQVPTPQVLFITARDQRRFLDFQHARYRRSARAIGEDVTLPRRFVVVPGTAARGVAAPGVEESR